MLVWLGVLPGALLALALVYGGGWHAVTLAVGLPGIMLGTVVATLNALPGLPMQHALLRRGAQRWVTASVVAAWLWLIVAAIIWSRELTPSGQLIAGIGPVIASLHVAWEFARQQGDTDDGSTRATG